MRTIDSESKRKQLFPANKPVPAQTPPFGPALLAPSRLLNLKEKRTVQHAPHVLLVDHGILLYQQKRGYPLQEPGDPSKGIHREAVPVHEQPELVQTHRRAGHALWVRRRVLHSVGTTKPSLLQDIH